MRKLLLGSLVVSVGLLAMALPLAAARGGHTSGTFNFLLGSGALCSLEEKACPDITMASNGDTVALDGSGSLSVHPSSVTGSGTFVHNNPSGHERAHGTWEAKALMSFVSYGNATPQGLPANLFGGKAVIRVTLLVGGTPVHDAVLTVYCLLGHPPNGSHEGIRLNVQDVINFNKQVSGDTVFMQ